MSLVHGSGSWEILTGHPKRVAGLKLAGLLAGHGEAETGDTCFCPMGRKGVRAHLAAGRPRGHKAREGAPGLQAGDIFSHGMSWLADPRACAWHGLPGRARGQRGTGTVRTELLGHTFAMAKPGRELGVLWELSSGQGPWERVGDTQGQQAPRTAPGRAGAGTGWLLPGRFSPAALQDSFPGTRSQLPGTPGSWESLGCLHVRPFKEFVLPS